MAALRVIFFTSCIFSFSFSFAQDTVWLTRGIAIAGVHHYGREALYTDQLAYRLYSNSLAIPAAGAASGIVDAKAAAINWQAMEADSLNRFRSRQFGGGGGYIYFTYTADKEKTALLNITGAGTVFFNGVPHAGDPYASGWLYIPVKLTKGLNQLYVRMSGAVTAKIIFPKTPVQLNTEDATLPAIIPGAGSNALQGALVVINSTAHDLKGLQVKSLIGGKETITGLPVVPRMSSRKCAFTFNAETITAKGTNECIVTLINNGKRMDEKKISIEAVGPTDKYSSTFTSAIDGSLQYYAVTPQIPAANGPAALFLSVHGAGVEAIGQAKAYKSKDWGTLVAATNRRPRGFNWEDWAGWMHWKY